ncbi:MAG TPA: 50S ribosomal protein L10 [Candidatus Nanoarchaeia archaeon]|nr:50S ribosomal protein L10 [Candidatus Nanoarchaeia archaeon]
MVSEIKKKLVQRITAAVKDYPVVGVVNLQSLPAQQLQKMRALLLKNGVEIVMARKRLLYRSLDNSGNENIEQLRDKIKGMPALLFSRSNPFTLYKSIQKNKSEAAAKAGQIAPKDIIVKAGPTNFAPGPIISELAAVGIKTKVESGKLAIIDNVTVAKEGTEISAKLAETLKRLDIKPMEVGLNLVAVWEKGIVFDAKQLHIDEAEYINKITEAARWSINLAVEAAITSPETTELLLQKAFREAKAIALEQHILIDETKEEILSKIEAQAKFLKEAAKLEISEAPKIKMEEGSSVVKEFPTEIKQKKQAQPSQLVGKESELPTAQELIRQTINKYEENNFPAKNKIQKKEVTAESLVDEEKALAEAERKQNKPEKKDPSLEETQKLFEELKKKGTLRDK